MLNYVKILLVSCLFYSLSVSAFKPSESYWPVWKDVLLNHLTVTQDGLTKFTVDGQARGFSPEAILEVQEANAGVDDNEADVKRAHCDEEYIGDVRGCSGRLIEIRDEIELILTTTDDPDVFYARERLGQALHTLQDFYAHSNWINLGHRDIYSALTHNEDPVSPQDEWEGENIEDKLGYETCVWDLESFDEKPLGILTLGPRGLEVVTTGWFAGFLGTADPLYYKCDHGIAEGNGLNKDTQNQSLHEEAVQVATLHTTDYVIRIIENVLASSTLTREQLDTNISKFLGQLPYANIGFIIDTTGSMGDIVAGIKNAMARSVDALKDDDKDISRFFLVSYGDPGIGEILTATNPDGMLANINSVQLRVPDDGGDAPELSLDALLKMVNAAANNTVLYLYTDETTKNPELASSIVSLANEKNIRINFLLSGNTDSAYTDVASGSQGDIHSYAHTVSGAEGTFVYIDPEFYGGTEKVTKLSGVLPGVIVGKNFPKTEVLKHFGATQLDTFHNYTIASTKTPYERLKKAGSEVIHDFLVDAESSQIFVNISMQQLGIVGLFRPDGTEVLVGDIDVTITKSNANSNFIVANPSQGEWRVRISGEAGQSYALSVDTISDIKILDFGFVEYKGRPEHQGLFPIEGLPLKSSSQTVSLTLTGKIKNLQMTLVSAEANILEQVEVELVKQDEFSSRYLGSVSLPEDVFSILVSGETQTGSKFERTYNQAYSGQSVEVRPISKISQLFSPGAQYDVGFKVTNTGDFDTFQLHAEMQDGTPIVLSKDGVSLTKGASEEVRVIFTLPEDLGGADKYNLTLTATSIANEKSNNFSVFTAKVDRSDFDLDGMSDDNELVIYDGNGDDIADYKQSNVVSLRAESGLGLTFALPEELSFVSSLVGSLTDQNLGLINDSSSHGYFEFETIGLAVGESKEIKIFYKDRFYPSALYSFDRTTNLWSEDTSAQLENGYALIQLKNNPYKGFFVYDNVAPKVFVSTQTTEENSAVMINLLENIQDADGDSVEISEIEVSSAKGGSISRVENDSERVFYTPPNNYQGKDTFEFTVTDNQGAFKTVRVEVEIVASSKSSSVPTTESTNESGGGVLGWFFWLIFLPIALFRQRRTGV
ncbi:MAG: cadherin-like domain-containing protein [Kangiellaceae bacterium]|nr:cadherin-like domain-containing protein [Kangiellaceae bacterium]